MAVLLCFNRFFNNNRLKMFKTESVKAIFAMNLNLTTFLLTFCALGSYCGHFLKVLQNTEKVWKLGMTTWPYLNSETIS